MAFITDSMILHMVRVRAIGQELFGSDLEPFLNTDDLDFADDLALRSHQQQPVSVSVTLGEEVIKEVEHFTYIVCGQRRWQLTHGETEADAKLQW